MIIQDISKTEYQTLQIENLEKDLTGFNLSISLNIFKRNISWEGLSIDLEQMHISYSFNELPGSHDLIKFQIQLFYCIFGVLKLTDWTEFFIKKTICDNLRLQTC